jgi:hypothetical protein
LVELVAIASGLQVFEAEVANPEAESDAAADRPRD